MYRRQIVAHGETITLRRLVPGGPPAELDVRARVTGFAPDELVGGIDQGDRKVILLAEDMTWTEAPAAGDKLVIRDQLLTIASVDDSTRRVAGTLIAYEMRATG